MDSTFPDRGGPFPGSKRMTPVEYREAMTLFLELQFSTQHAGIEVASDVKWPGWIFLKLPHATQSDHHIILAVPLTDGEWGAAVTSGFYWITGDR